jgi:hypothetical protein
MLLGELKKFRCERSELQASLKAADVYQSPDLFETGARKACGTNYRASCEFEVQMSEGEYAVTENRCQCANPFLG